MTLNDTFFFAVVIIIVMSVFIGALCPAGTASFSVGTTIETPSGWDLIFSAFSAFFGLLFFSIPGAPAGLSIFTWFLTFIIIWTIIRVIRGL